MPNEKDNTVSFRLPQEVHDKLVQLATASDVSKHHAARMLVTRSLQLASCEDEADSLAGVEDAFAAVLANLTHLRMGVGRGIGFILQHVAPDMDKQQIRRWVFEKIITSSPRQNDAGGE